MPTPFDRRPEPVGAVTTSPADLARRSLERRTRERRQWAARSFTGLIVFGLVVLGVILLRRDGVLRGEYMNSLQAYVNVLNAGLEKQRQENWARLLLPAEWDVSGVSPRPSISFRSFQYYDDAIRLFAQTHNGAVIVAWPWGPVEMTITATGRAVALYENGRVRAEWWKESEFGRRFGEQKKQVETMLRNAEREPARLK